MEDPDKKKRQTDSFDVTRTSSELERRGAESGSHNTAATESAGHPQIGASSTSGAFHALTQTFNNSPALTGQQTGAGARVLSPGDLIGGEDGQRFQLIEQIGTGAMGVVFLAIDRLLDRTVAIKFIMPGKERMSHSAVVELVKSEARATAKLSHENIVRIFDVGAHEGVPFQIMEYLEGRLLSTAMAHGEIDILRATRIMIDITRGLAHAHKFGVIHRDLKPANIFLVKDGRAKILDLGLARIAAGFARHGAQLPAISGTPLYMSPEQWRGDSQDGRTDIWSVGVIFFELLTGQKPFAGQRAIEEIRVQVLSPAPAPLLRSQRPDLPVEAERIVERALSKEPERRYSSADELLDALVGLEVALTYSRRTAARELQQTRLGLARTERRQMTLLSCALSDVAALSERLPADDYAELLAGFFKSSSTIIGQLEGTLVASVGGRVLACFGYPIAHEDGAPRALRAALLIRDTIPTLSGGQALRAVQIGIHTGMAIVSTLPNPSPEAPPLIQGEVPYVATWLEQKAAHGEILISHATHLLTRGLFEVEPLGTDTPGTRALELYRLLRPRKVSSRFERVAADLTPLVGRASEAEELQTLWELAKRGQGQMLLLSGEAGIGKSRLMELIRTRAAGESGARLSCQCWSHFYNSALYPVAEGLQRLLGIGPETTAADGLARLEAMLSSLGLPCAEYVPLLASLLSIPLSRPYTQPTLSPEDFKRNLLEALTSMLLALAAQKPTLLLVEDVHWSDVLTLELLDSVFQRMTASKLLIVLSFRPDFQPQWAQRAHLHRISLQRLSPEETKAMVALATGGQALPTELLEKVVHRTDGIPLFVEELARIVSDSWNAAKASGEPTTVESLSTRVIPSTLQELLLSRLDTLTEEGREVAQLGAVIGREFTYKLIQSASDLDEETLRRGLMQVVDSGLLRYQGQQPEAKYTFKHALVQDAAYQSLAKSERKLHHLRVARALIEHFPAVAEAQPELVAHHYLDGGDSEQAITWLEQAGQRSVQRSAHVDAVAHYSRALQLLKTLPMSPQRDRKELLLQIAYGAPLMSTRGYAAPEVHATYARARELCRLGGDDAQLFPAVLGLWQSYMVRGEVQISTELGRQLLTQAQITHDPIKLMLAYRALGTSMFLAGDPVACREHTEKGLLLYSREQHGKLVLRFGQDPGVSNGLYCGWALWFLGYVDQGLRRAEEALELARALNHPLSIAFAMTYLAMVHNYRNEYVAARKLAEEAMEISTEHRLALWYAMSKIQRGWSVLSMGEAEGAEVLKEGVLGWKKTGAATGLTCFLSQLIWSQWQAGHLDEAMQTLEEVETVMNAKGEHFFEPELLRLRGEVTLASGAGEALAEKCFLRGLEVARRQQAKSWDLRLCTSLGHLLKKQGRSAEARRFLEPVCGWFTEGLGTTDFLRARELLTELGKGD